MVKTIIIYILSAIFVAISTISIIKNRYKVKIVEQDQTIWQINQQKFNLISLSLDSLMNIRIGKLEDENKCINWK